MLNVVAIMGRVVANPELRQTPQGTSVTTFSVACDRSFARQGEERQCDFFDVTCWRQTADFVCKYFQKGSLIAIDGRLQSRRYTDKNGNNRTAIEIVANNVNFAGPKSTNGGNGNYNNNSYAAPASNNGGYNAPRANTMEAAPSYSAGSDDEFAFVDDSNDDLPF